MLTKRVKVQHKTFTFYIQFFALFSFFEPAGPDLSLQIWICYLGGAWKPESAEFPSDQLIFDHKES